MDAFTALPTLPPEQRWRNQTAPVPIVVGLIRRAFDDGERLLLIRRAAGPYAGQWALVGGKWEFGETLPEAIVREVAEETGLSAAFVAVRGVVSERVAPWSAGTLGAHFLLLVCDLLAGDGEATEQDEGFVAWFDHPAIDALRAAGEIIPSDYAMIREFAAATDRAPHVEVRMRASLGGVSEAQSEMIYFERCDGCG
jgi:ADP-ribose pyrophosphatase YjhB (NUDIX family)